MDGKSSKALIVTAIFVAVSVGCKAGSPAPLDKTKVDVNPNAQLRTDVVGMGKYQRDATFVLVDAINETGQDAMITLGGVLVDAKGATVAALTPESLFVPKGDKRAFALVDSKAQARPTAVGASVKVRSALVPTPTSMSIVKQRTYDDFGKPVVDVWIESRAKNAGDVVVIAAFYDAEERPLTRPFQIVRLGAGATLSVQFVGPPKAVRAVAYLGEQRWTFIEPAMLDEK